MVTTPRNDTFELAVVNEKRPLPSAPPMELEPTKRPPRKRCWTVVTLGVVLLVAIGAGTIVFYEHLTGRLPAESSNGYGPRLDTVAGSEVVPALSDPFPEESSKRPSSTSTTTATSTEVYIFIDGGAEDENDGGVVGEEIYINSQERSVESNGTSEEGSGDVTDPLSSSEEGEGSGSGSGDGSER